MQKQLLLMERKTWRKGKTKSQEEESQRRVTESCVWAHMLAQELWVGQVAPASTCLSSCSSCFLLRAHSSMFLSTSNYSVPTLVQKLHFYILASNKIVIISLKLHLSLTSWLWCFGLHPGLCERHLGAHLVTGTRSSSVCSHTVCFNSYSWCDVVCLFFF